MNNNLKEEFYQIVEEHLELKNLISKLSDKGEILLFGGAVRQYLEDGFKNMPRDFDIVINSDDECDLDECFENLEFKKNRYDGYKVNVDELQFDIWRMKNTWAFKEQKVEMKEENLPDTVFLNIDSIVYNLNKGKMYCEKYEESLQTKVLDIVLEDNPFVELNLLRAIVFKKKYNMNISENLREYFKRFALKSKEDFVANLYQLQDSHYGQRYFSMESINREVYEIVQMDN